MQNGTDNLFDQISAEQAQRLNPLVLAFVGDSVQTLYIRTKLAISHDSRSGALHKLAADIINASAQAKTFEALREVFTEEELSIYRRARNSKTGSSAKNAKITDYRKATGFEAVLGYLYLTGNYTRLEEMLLKSCENGENNNKKQTEEENAQSNP